MNSNFRNLAIWVVIGLLLMALFNLFQSPSQSRNRNEISYTDFLTAVDAGSVADVTISKHRVTGTYRDKSSTFTTVTPDDPNLVSRLTKKDVKITVRPPDEDVPSILGVLVNWFPMLLLIGVWVFFMRQMQSGGGRAMGFGKSKAKVLTERHGRVTFDDVAGVDEAKSDLQEIVEFLRDPQKFQRLGGRIPRGALLVGPPGTGKTLLARAIAGEANVPFFTISGSDFVEMFVGVGASRVRDMFEQAKKNAPCIIFIDEIDAVGRHRGAGLGGGNDEREQTLNQLLVEMDGFEANEGIILIAATNRPDVLDPALLRPGRFDRQIIVPNPDVAGREKILKVHMRKVPLAPDVDAKVIARGTPGFSGADLANLVNEAALLAARRNKRLVTQIEFEDSKDKVMMGAERRSMIMTEEEKLATAYHEGGHALVSLLVPGGDPLHKVTIIPRGRALGVTMSLPERDKLSYSLQWCTARIATMFGGRVAEQLIYGEDHLNTGASSDIMQATELARRMVTEWGMSDKLGPLRYNENQQEVFLGHAITQRQNMSEDTAKLIDIEIRRIVTDGERRAREVLFANRDKLEAITQALMEFETISGEEVKALIRGEKIVRTQDDEESKGPAGPAVPAAGKLRPPRPEPGTGGLEPQPQT
jgi:cell division protease FtsH